MGFAETLESYMIAMEKINFNDMIEDWDLKFKSNAATVKGNSYNLKGMDLKSLLNTMANDNWSESDFIKFIESTIDTSEYAVDIDGYFEDKKYPKDAAKNRAVYRSYKMVPICPNYSGDYLCYSKAKHRFYIIAHDIGGDEFYQNNISWKDAISKFSTAALEAYRASTNKATDTINFFGKKWTVRVDADGRQLLDSEKKNALKVFKTRAAKLSKEYERKFVQYANSVYINYSDEIVENYNDITGLELTDVILSTLKSGKIAVILAGEFDADAEHGWSMSFVDNKLIGCGQFMEYEQII